MQRQPGKELHVTYRLQTLASLGCGTHGTGR